MARPDSPSHVLLVEGQDDKHVVLQLCERHRSAPSFSILVKDGVSPLLESIDLEIKVPGRQTVGILVDANDDIEARWGAIQNRLQRAGINSPQSPSPDGTIIQADPRLGIWLMPDNSSVGELEDFVVQMIPEGDRVWLLSRRYIEEIPQEERKFSDGKILRAQLYAWLAAREDPRRMGLAIRAQDLEVDGDLSRKFVAWLNKLFG